MGKKSKNLFMSAVAAISLSCCIFGTILPVNAATEDSEIKTGSAVLETNISIEGHEMQAPEDLFEKYIDRFLYEEVENPAAMWNVGGQRIKSKEEKAFYEEMKVKIKEIATGKRQSTKMKLDMTMKWTAAELGVSEITSSEADYIVSVMMKSNFNFGNMISYLLMDCPYELYWYDKTLGTRLSYSYSYTDKEIMIYNFAVSMPVVPEYQATSGSASQKIYTLNTSAVNTVENAKNKALEIVAETAHLSKYERLVAFKDKICDLTEYNDEAAADSNMDYGNPWQMIWVFDGDPSTNVVCEGYSKAFQYLCDMSGITCYIVSGRMGSSGGGGPHMWNVVKFGGVNYLVDITNCDDGTIGYPDKLFMAGTEGSVDKGYTFPQYRNLTYTYDANQDDLIGWSNLNLAASKFDTSQISYLNLSFAETQWTVPYKKGTPELPELSVKKDGTAVSDAKIRYMFRKNGSNGAFKDGLPNEPGTFQVKAAANGDYYWTSESSNTVLLTIQDSVAWKFKDIQGYEWHFDYVQSAYDQNLMTGVAGTNLFQPDANITKAQVAQVLYNMEGKPWASDITVFYVLEDVYEEEWYADAVAWAYDAGIITGDLYTKKFLPNASVTREQLALMIYRYADYKGYDVSQSSDLEGLKNNWKVNTYAETAVKWAVGSGLISGIEKNGAKDLAPQGTASRAQVATILTRFSSSIK